MNVTISSDNQEFVESSVESGRYADKDELLNEALRLLKRRDELVRAVNAGVEQINRGETVDGEQMFERMIARLRSKTNQ